MGAWVLEKMGGVGAWVLEKMGGVGAWVLEKMGGVILRGGCMGTRENGWGDIKGWVHGY